MGQHRAAIEFAVSAVAEIVVSIDQSHASIAVQVGVMAVSAACLPVRRENFSFVPSLADRSHVALVGRALQFIEKLKRVE